MSAGRVNVKQEEIDEMLKEAPGPINFTVFLTMFGEKLKGRPRPQPCHRPTNQGQAEVETMSLTHCPPGTSSPGADPEETILNAFKVFDPEAKGVLRKDE